MKNKCQEYQTTATEDKILQQMTKRLNGTSLWTHRYGFSTTWTLNSDEYIIVNFKQPLCPEIYYAGLYLSISQNFRYVSKAVM